MNDKSIAGPLMTTEEMLAQISNSDLITELVLRLLLEKISMNDVINAIIEKKKC